MKRVVEPLAKDLGFTTLGLPKGGTIQEMILDNAKSLVNEIKAGRRVFFVNSGTSEFVESELKELRSLGLERVKAGTVKVGQDEFDLFEFVVMEQ